MAYDETLAERIRELLGMRPDLVEKKMFGGIAFMVGGHMAVGIVGEDLMVRVGPEGFAKALAEPHARPMDFTGTPSKNMVYVAPDGVRTEKALATWVERGVRFADGLPPKVARPVKRTSTSGSKPTKKKARKR